MTGTGEVVTAAGCVVEAAVCVVAVAGTVVVVVASVAVVVAAEVVVPVNGTGVVVVGSAAVVVVPGTKQESRAVCQQDVNTKQTPTPGRRSPRNSSVDRSIDRSLTSVVFAAAAARGSESAIGHVSGWTVNERAVSGMLSGAFGALSHIGHRIDARLTNETKPTDRLDSRFTNEHVTRTVPFADATQADRRRRRIGTLRPFDARRRPKEKC